MFFRDHDPVIGVSRKTTGQYLPFLLLRIFSRRNRDKTDKMEIRRRKVQGPICVPFPHLMACSLGAPMGALCSTLLVSSSCSGRHESCLLRGCPDHLIYTLDT